MIKKTIKNEQGFVLITSLLMLTVLMIIGIAATNTTDIELQISGNDKAAKQSFYLAEGGAEAAIEVVEQNFACATGFTFGGVGFDDDDPATFFSIGGVNVFDSQFAFDEGLTDVARADGVSAPATIGDLPTDSLRSLRLPDDPSNLTDGLSHSNIAAYGVMDYSEGSAIQMAAGYEGKGHSAADGGAIRRMNILSEHLGGNNAVAKIHLRWNHLLGQEGNCRY